MTSQSTTTKEALEPCPWCKAAPTQTDLAPSQRYRIIHEPACFLVGRLTDPWGREGRSHFIALRDAEAWNSTRIPAPIVAPEVDENSAVFTAYNQAIEDAKSAIRHESQGGGYWAAAYINAIARRCSPHVYVNRLAPASTAAPQQSEWLLDCPMCNAPRSFAIDSSDDAVGFCLAERRNWRIIDTTCSTDGCFQPKATFGDLCMGCLAKAVDSQ